MNADANELVDLLEQLARDYPAQPEWSQLANQVRGEIAMIQPQEKRPPVPTRPMPTANNGLCALCGLSPPVDGAMMCLDCAAMYPSVDGRAVPDLCGCGHRAAARHVYVYRKGRDEHSLCGLTCAQAHFRKTLAPFLRDAS